MGQSYTDFKDVFDKVMQVYTSTYQNDLIKQSKIFSKLMKPIDYGKDGKPVGGLETFEGRYEKIAINANYPVTTANLGKYAIQHGDEIEPESERNLILAEFSAVDKGFSMQIYLSDIQALKSKGGSVSSRYVNWIDSNWRDYIKGFALSIDYGIIAGTGTSTYNGKSRPDFYGLPTIAGSGSYGGITSAQWNEWQGHSFNTNSSLFGMTYSTSFDTIAHMTTVITNQSTTPFIRYLEGVARRMKLYGSTNIKCILTPAQYDLLFLPSLEAQRKSGVFISDISNKKEQSVVKNEMGYLIEGMEIMVNDTIMPTTSIGGNPKFLQTNDYIWFIDFDTLHLKVETSANFTMSDWIELPGQHKTMIKKVDATLLFYCNKRYYNAYGTLQTALVSELDEAYGSL